MKWIHAGQRSMGESVSPGSFVLSTDSCLKGYKLKTFPVILPSQLRKNWRAPDLTGALLMDPN